MARYRECISVFSDIYLCWHQADNTPYTAHRYGVESTRGWKVDLAVLTTLHQRSYSDALEKPRLPRPTRFSQVTKGIIQQKTMRDSDSCCISSSYCFVFDMLYNLDLEPMSVYHIKLALQIEKPKSKKHRVAWCFVVLQSTLTPPYILRMNM